MATTEHDTAEHIMRGRDGHGLLRFLEERPELDHLRIELVEGKIVMRRSGPPFRTRTVALLGTQMEFAGWAGLSGQALISGVPGSEPKADLVVTTDEAMQDNCHPYPADRVHLVVEVVEKVVSERDSDYAGKRRWYARSRIPLHLLVDPNEGAVELHSQPGDLDYGRVDRYRFGEPVALPEPFSFAVDTRRFRAYASAKS
ncbi:MULTISPECIES: Uma2 family endonuclease [Streptomyces]|uniref:Uma2 family endonuclease n=1 Tax=Streptomyces TaxID=1883 RepID=UPI00067B0CB1|nr:MULTISPECIES: Uma2 family endonuclease [Streptomyces]